MTFWQPKTEEPPKWNAPQPWQPQAQTQPWAMSQSVPQVAPVASAPQIQAPTKEKELAIPLWQRALQLFSAPFEWADETIIKPSLAVGASALGLEQLERLPGEDYFDWKKRSWEAWKAPGFDIDVPFGDGDIRIDVKGLLEFAPWLLIPGAGAVGTGAKAGIGVAGALGKMGKVGRTLGKAIEFSPWGLVEKGAATTIKGTFKGLAKVTGRAEAKVVGEITQKEVTPAVKEFTQFFKESVIPKFTEFQKAKPTVYTRGEAATREIFARQRKGEITGAQAIEESMKSLKGGGVKSEFNIPSWERVAIQKNTEELLGDIIKATERGYTNLDEATALLELLTNGVVPQPHHIKAFARVFGKEFAETVGQLKGVKESTLDKVINFLNIPRAVLASGDISGVARQGLILGLVHPTKVPRSFTKMMKSLFSEKLALEADDVMRADPLFNEFTQIAKGYIAPLEGAVLGKMEEAFASSIARHFPFTRRSERAFITYLNELRFGSYKAASGAVKAMGGGDKELEMLGRFINLASGRGDLPKDLSKFAPMLNTILFSPRLQAATLELPVQLGRMFMSKNPYMRKEAAKALVTFAGGGTALLMLLKNSGAAKVEFDPRSGDFGKLVIGETRLDIWRGYAQYGRFAAQMLTEQKKSAYGNMSKKDRFDTAFRFLQSKSSPAFGLMVDMLKGETYMGDPLFEGTTGTIKGVRERMMPLALQEIMDGMEQSGVNGLWTSAPALIGIGTLTYIDEFVKTKDRIAKDAGFETWDEIDPKTKREIQNRSAELQAAQIQFDRRVMGTAWGDYRNAGNAIEEVFKEDIELASSQYRATGDGVQFRGKVSDAFTARRGGYASRDKEERFSEIVRRNEIKDTAASAILLGEEQMAINTYNDALYGDDMYDEFGDYRFDEAEIRKQLLIEQLGEERFGYVEEYRGEKYTLLPQEYQDLAQAKIIMKPYWDIQGEVERMFGKFYTESSRGQALISKLRKNKRKTNPEIEAAYQRFYAQNK